MIEFSLKSSNRFQSFWQDDATSIMIVILLPVPKNRKTNDIPNIKTRTRTTIAPEKEVRASCVTYLMLLMLLLLYHRHVVDMLWVTTENCHTLSFFPSFISGFGSIVDADDHVVVVVVVVVVDYHTFAAFLACTINARPGFS